MKEDRLQLACFHCHPTSIKAWQILFSCHQESLAVIPKPKPNGLFQLGAGCFIHQLGASSSQAVEAQRNNSC